MEESYKCKFCFKSFINGRALGGHMRSHTHMPTLDHQFQDDEEERPSQLSYETESDVSSQEEEDDHDPKFGFTEEDGESETNVVVTNLTRKRSKRTRKLESFGVKKTKPSQLGYNNNPELWNESSEPPHSSEAAASDTTTEEDLAFCLMLLSRDKWKKERTNQELEEEEEESEPEDYNNKSSKICNNRNKGRYKCETCGKVFKSYQALGGHRASHKKNRVCVNKTEQRSEKTEYGENVVAEKRIHQCPICLRVFASGQALGGHKRSHGIGNLSVNQQVHRESVMMKQRMIDLNLPAPNEEEYEVVSSSMVLFQ